MINFTSTVTSPKTKQNVDDIMAALKALSNNRVLVGVPSEKTDRTFSVEDWEDRGKKPIKSKPTNALLALIHDNGAPSVGIPARPFMKPGIAKAQDRINKEFMAAAKASLSGDDAEVAIRLNRAGLIAQNSIRRVIMTGENFAPLKRGTLLSRTSKRGYLWHHLTKDEAAGLNVKQKKDLRSGKREEIMSSLKPLVDTGQLVKSISYVIENTKTGDVIEAAE